MKKRKILRVAVFIGLIGCFGFIGGRVESTAQAQDETIRYRLPQGIYLDVPKDVLEANGGELPENLALSNQFTSAYLEEIAASNQTLIQRNNEIIQQQSRIIQLLEALLQQPAAEQQ